MKQELTNTINLLAANPFNAIAPVDFPGAFLNSVMPEVRDHVF